MQSITISLPESLREFIDSEAHRRGFDATGDFVVDLIRQAHGQSMEQDFRVKITEGLQSPCKEMTDADWQRLRQGILDKHPELAGE